MKKTVDMAWRTVWLSGHHKILPTTRKRVEISQKTGKIEIKNLREGLAETIVNYQRGVGVNEY